MNGHGTRSGEASGDINTEAYVVRVGTGYGIDQDEDSLGWVSEKE